MKHVIPAACLLLLACNLILLLRYHSGTEHLSDLAPQEYYHLDMQIDMATGGESAYAHVFIPQQNPSQRIINERIEAQGLSVNQIEHGEERQLVINSLSKRGQHSAHYRASIFTKRESFKLTDDIILGKTLSQSLHKHLMPSKHIQVDDPIIHNLAKNIVGNENILSRKIYKLYNYVSTQIKNSSYENTLDAISVNKWKEAFCGGKSRLLVALLRNQGIPSRVCGGLILNDGYKKKTHVWVEAWVNGLWIPLDPTNNHYCVKPKHYLKLYNGDQSLVKRSDDINFQYRYAIEVLSGTPDEALEALSANSLSPWALMTSAGIDFSVLRVFLLLPVSVLIILFFRNIIGLECIGTFVPALLAMSFYETGLIYGVSMLSCVLVAGLAMRFYLERFQLLNTPRLAILVISVIILVMLLSIAFVMYGDLRPEQLSVYPIIILVAAVEQVFNAVQERGWHKAILLSLGTLAVVAIIHLFVSWPLLQALIYSHPELLLVVIVAYLLLGRYAGLRLSELFRFKSIYLRKVKV